MVMNDTRLDPYMFVSKLLSMFFSGAQYIKFADFKAFLLRFESYFNKSDLELFLIEVKLL